LIGFLVLRARAQGENERYRLLEHRWTRRQNSSTELCPRCARVVEGGSLYCPGDESFSSETQRFDPDVCVIQSHNSRLQRKSSW